MNTSTLLALTLTVLATAALAQAEGTRILTIYLPASNPTPPPTTWTQAQPLWQPQPASFAPTYQTWSTLPTQPYVYSRPAPYPYVYPPTTRRYVVYRDDNNVLHPVTVLHGGSCRPSGNRGGYDC